MKPTLMLLGAILFLTVSSPGQYTPLPALDQPGFEKFISVLKTQADEQCLPELKTIAENMSYDEARRFLANPHVFAEKLKNEVKPDGQVSVDKIRFGIIVNILLNHLISLPGNYESAAQIGYALGLYAMFVLGSVYLVPELLFMYRPAGEKLTGYKHILKISYLTLYMNFMYMLQGQQLRWMFGGGPAFALGLSGKDKTTIGNNTSEADVKFGDGGLRRFQAGINLQTGVMINATILIYLSYTYYFTKLFTGSSSDIAMNTLRLGLAYTFSQAH